MALSRISLTPIIASLVLVFAWTDFKWTGTPARTEQGPVVVAATGTRTATEPGPDDDKEVLERGRELFTRE